MTAATPLGARPTRPEPTPRLVSTSPGRRPLVATALVVPAAVSAAVLAGAAFPAPALRDAVTGQPVSDVVLALPWAYVLLAPWCDALDTLTLLSARQHLALIGSVLAGYAGWRIWRRGRSRPTLWREGEPGAVRAAAVGRRVLRELGGLAATLLAIVAVYAANLAPRPMAALRVHDPDVVTVDFHSHTNASWDGRAGFGPEESRAWHRGAGFDVAYVTDHRSFAGAAAADAHNPRSAGDGTTLLTGIETRYRAQHLNVLGATARTGAAFLAGEVHAPALASVAGTLPAPGLVLLTVPSWLGEVPQVRDDGGGSGGVVRAIELSDGSPRGLGQLDSARSRVLRLADSLDLAVVAGSDNHGWGRTAAAWSLLTVPGWRDASPPALSGLLTAVIRRRGRRAARVVERRRASLSSRTSLALTAPVAAWTMLDQLRWPERLSWLGWTWVAGLGRLVRRRRDVAGVIPVDVGGRPRPVRGRARTPALEAGSVVVAAVFGLGTPRARADAQTPQRDDAPSRRPAASGVAPADTAVRPAALLSARDAAVGAGFALATVGLLPFDRRIATQLQRPGLQRRGTLDHAARGFELLAIPGVFVGSGTAYLAGRLGQRPSLADAGLHVGEATVVGAALTTVLKSAFGRARPYVSADTNPRDFGVGRGLTKGEDYSAFPSGHTTVAFAAASALASETAHRWPHATPVVAPLAYGGATLVGLARMYHDKHWASDVALGAGVGTLGGLAVVRFQHAHPRNWIDRTLLAATVAPTAGGLTVVWSVPAGPVQRDTSVPARR